MSITTERVRYQFACVCGDAVQLRFNGPSRGMAAALRWVWDLVHGEHEQGEQR